MCDRLRHTMLNQQVTSLLLTNLLIRRTIGLVLRNESSPVEASCVIMELAIDVRDFSTHGRADGDMFCSLGWASTIARRNTLSMKILRIAEDADTTLNATLHLLRKDASNRIGTASGIGGHSTNLISIDPIQKRVKKRAPVAYIGGQLRNEYTLIDQRFGHQLTRGSIETRSSFFDI